LPLPARIVRNYETVRNGRRENCVRYQIDICGKGERRKGRLRSFRERGRERGKEEDRSDTVV